MLRAPTSTPPPTDHYWSIAHRCSVLRESIAWSPKRQAVLVLWLDFVACGDRKALNGERREHPCVNDPSQMAQTTKRVQYDAIVSEEALGAHLPT